MKRYTMSGIVIRVIIAVLICVPLAAQEKTAATDTAGPKVVEPEKSVAGEKASDKAAADTAKPAEKAKKAPAGKTKKTARTAKRTTAKKTPAKTVRKDDTVKTYELDDKLEKVSDKVIPSVVSVHVVKGGERNGFSTSDTPSFPRNSPVARPSTIVYGSGIILDKRGNIVTNYHVVRNAASIRVQLFDMREYSCDLVGIDPVTDIAVIRITLNVPPDISPISFLDSSKVRTGQLAIAVGNSYGFSNTVTLGIVSNVGRSTEQFAEAGDYIQTDASLNPGNSGGALVDLNGNLIGMNTAIYSRTGGSVGLGFSIPANSIKSVAARIISQGAVLRGWSGLVIQDLNPDVAQKLSLPQGRGVVVVDVVKRSPADASGMATGDVVLSADGAVMTSARALQEKIVEKKPGERITLQVLRKGKKTECVIYMGNYPEAPDENPLKKGGRLLGLYVNDLDEENSYQYGINDKHGVVIVRLDTGMAAESSGLEVGDLVKEIDGKPVGNMELFSRVIDEFRDRGSILFLVKRHNVQKFVTVYMR